jgi:hypothetical protein
MWHAGSSFYDLEDNRSQLAQGCIVSTTTAVFRYYLVMPGNVMVKLFKITERCVQSMAVGKQYSSRHGEILITNHGMLSNTLPVSLMSRVILDLVRRYPVCGP